jgi:hypothetical protein
VNFVWSTATETGNVGFNLYFKDGSQFTQVNPSLIPSHVIDSLERQDYTYSARVNGNSFYIEDVSVLGKTTRYGPFQLGQTYGVQLTGEKINWTAIQAEHTSKQVTSQDALKQGMAGSKASGKEGGSVSAAAVAPYKTSTPTKILAPARTATPTRTLRPTKTFTPTKTSKATATATPTATEIAPTATEVPSATATEVTQPTATETYTPSETYTATATDIPTATATATATALPPATAVAYDPRDLQLKTTYNFKVSQTGLYRVSYEMLQAAGLDLAGVPASEITVLNRNLMVPVTVHTGDASGNFGAGGYIEFYGEALDTLYTGTNIYTVQVSNAVVPQIPGTDGGAGIGLSPVGSYTETLKVNNQNNYATYAPGRDIWYDTFMESDGTPKSWSFTFQLNGLADAAAPANLELVVWGGDAVAQNPDHHVQVAINGVGVADTRFDGIVEKQLNISVPGGTLREGANTMQLTLPGDTGAAYDVVFLDQYSLSYQRQFQAQSGRLTFQAAGAEFSVTNLASANVLVYRMSGNGGMQRLENVSVQANGSTYTASFAGTQSADTYLVTSVEALNTPVLEAMRQPANLDQAAQYLIISHPDFITGIQPLVAYHQAQGMSVSVVDVNDLYAKYTYGIFDPSAIKQYIAYAAKNLGTKYVLLVGGDTFDYRNYLKKNGISFIPSLYTATGPEATYVPVDPLYADLNGDNVPDLAIGRLPVRSTAELGMVVSKTLAYTGKTYGQTAFFASDANDGIVSYKDVSNGMAAGLPSSWSVHSVSLDDMSVASAKAQLLAAMNGGTALVNFTGHSGPQEWTFDNLFANADAAGLTNAGKPFVVVQWGCWNTYYVDPIYSYLVQKFLFSGDKGAAAVLGGTTLVDSTSEQMLGDLLTPRLVSPGMSIGQALEDAKTELAKTHPEMLDVLLGWSLMGDPGLVIQP